MVPEDDEELARAVRQGPLGDKTLLTATPPDRLKESQPNEVLLQRSDPLRAPGDAHELSVGEPVLAVGDVAEDWPALRSPQAKSANEAKSAEATKIDEAAPGVGMGEAPQPLKRGGDRNDGSAVDWCSRRRRRLTAKDRRAAPGQGPQLLVDERDVIAMAGQQGLETSASVKGNIWKWIARHAAT
jgi:hypothetical protein